jgi:hypothetical protein
MATRTMRICPHNQPTIDNDRFPPGTVLSAASSTLRFNQADMLDMVSVQPGQESVLLFG